MGQEVRRQDVPGVTLTDGWLPKLFRSKCKTRHVLLERTGVLHAVLGASIIIAIGFWARNEISAAREQTVTSYRIIEAENEDIDSIKFSHYYSLTTDKNYVSSPEFHERAKRISENEKRKQLNRDFVEEDTRRREANFDKALFSSAVSILLISVVTLNLGSGLISRSLAIKLEERFDDDKKGR